MDNRLNDPEALRAAYATKSATAIAAEFGCCKSTVINRLVQFGISRRDKTSHTLGRKLSPQTRARMSAERKVYWDAHPEAKIEMSALTKEYWQSHPHTAERNLKVSQAKRKHGLTMGYRWIYVPGVGPVAEHRYLMEKMTGRPLRSDEHVHHKDGDKLNNALDNLELLTAAEHAARHNVERERTESGKFSS